MNKKLSVFIFGLLVQMASAQIFDVDTIQYTGPIDNRINLVILGDGYTIEEMSRFKSDASNFSRALLSESPFSNYKNYFNIYTIETPSKESGASHPRVGKDNHGEFDVHPFLEVDNYFGSSFDQYGIHRLLVPTKTFKIINVLANNFPSYDIAIIIVNTDYYGGAGGKFASASAKIPEIIIHEMSHSFSGLADEYYAGDHYFKESVNMTKQNDPVIIKWKNWVNTNGVNIFPYEGSTIATSWYHPHENCKMGNINRPLCSVCVEGTIEKIHSYVSPIDSFSPSNKDLINLSSSTEVSLVLNQPNPNTLNIDWYLNDIIINNNVEAVLLNSDNLDDGVNQIQAVVEDDSSLLRIENHETFHIYSVLWTIDSSTLSIVNVSEEYLKVELFPNPTNEFVNIDLNGELGDEIIIMVYDLTGIELLKKRVVQRSEPIELNLKHLKSGIYIMKFQLNNGHTISRKIIKE